MFANALMVTSPLANSESIPGFWVWYGLGGVILIVTRYLRLSVVATSTHWETVRLAVPMPSLPACL